MPAQDLKIKAVLGFNGKIPSSLVYTPCGKYILYPLGSFVVIKNVKTGKEAFLDSHTNEVSCIAVSSNGSRLASGQINYHGVKADVIVWDLDKAKQLLDSGKVMVGDACAIHFLKQHIGKVQFVAFSKQSNYLSTLGGQDDNALVIWDVSSGVPLCGSPAGPDSALSCKWLHGRNDRFVTCGFYHVRIWQIDPRLPKLHPVDMKFGGVKRVFNCLDITNDDQFCYLGTGTGDLVKISIDRDEIHGPNEPDNILPTLIGVSKDRLQLGLNSCLVLINPSTGNHNICSGSGDGTLTLFNSNLGLCKKNTTSLKGGVTSISQNITNGKLIVGTAQSNRYDVTRDLMEATLISSCHYGPINDVAFPYGCPDLIVTSSTGDIRVWNILKKQELLRIQIPNFDCLCSLVTPSGQLIISGWDDGKIRSFLPETGKLKFTIIDAHDKVTSLAVLDHDSRDPWRIVSGGQDGKLRVWNVTKSHQAMVASLKEHRGPINCIKVNQDNTKCISASSDGSCIVWDLQRYVRLSAIFENNMFNSVVFHPDESQYMTCGSNHKLSYWDATKAECIRILDASEGVMTTLDIEPKNGDFVISGSEDHLIKVWHYDDGEVIAYGRGHSGVVKALKISPDVKSVVSVGTSGEIIFWELPKFSDMQRK